MLLASLCVVERDCSWGEGGIRKKGQAGFWGASAPPGAGFCSLLSSLLPLQQLWLAWHVFKLIQLSGGLFLVQSALDLAAAQSFAKLLPWMLLVWRGWSVTLALPTLTPPLPALSQDNPSPAPVPPLQDYFYPTFNARLSEHTGEHIAAVTGPWQTCGQQLPPPWLSVRAEQSERAVDVHPGRGGMEAAVLCSARCRRTE